MRRESVKNNHLRLYQFEENPKERHDEAFQSDFLLLLQNEDFSCKSLLSQRVCICWKKEQWKEDLLMYINDYEGEQVFDEVDVVKVKGLNSTLSKMVAEQ